jgi:hypothetical protein
MKTEGLFALRWERSVLTADLEAITWGEAGSRLTDSDARYFTSRLSALDLLIAQQLASGKSALTDPAP